MSVIHFEGASYGGILGAVRSVVYEPIATGSLLYILTLGPVNLRERLLEPLSTNLLATNRAGRITTVVAVVKACFILGVISRVNKALNSFALNGWSFKRQGAPFEFGPERKELVVITGGSSGFGYEMVKAFAQVARVVSMDVSELPEELKKCEFRPSIHFLEGIYHPCISWVEMMQRAQASNPRFVNHYARMLT